MAHCLLEHYVTSKLVQVLHVHLKWTTFTSHLYT